jgi:hypothetical protein
MTFLERFFGPGNRIGWASLQASGSRQRDKLTAFLPLVESGAELAFLPRVVQEAGANQQVRWYVLCRTDAAQRRGQELIGAFLGPSYLQGSGPPNKLDPDDPIDAAVVQCIGPRSFWVAVPKTLPKDLEAGANTADPIRARLQLLAQLLEETPVRTLQSHRPVGRVLRDFEFATTARDAQTAATCLVELDSAGYLTAANRQFLGVRLDAIRGDWKKLADPARIEEHLALRPPRQIVQLLIEAVYESHLRAFDNPTHAPELLAKFKGLDTRYRALLRSHRGVSGYAVDLCFLLDAVAYSDSPAVAADEVLARVPATATGRTVLESVARLAPTPAVEPVRAGAPNQATALQRAAAAFTFGALDEAFVLALGAANAIERTALLLQIAAEARTIETLAAARDALASTTLAQRAQLKRLKRTSDAIHLLEEFERPANPQPTIQKGNSLPASWTEWLERLESKDVWTYAVKAARELGSQWNVAAALASPEAMDAFVERLEATRSDWGQAAFRDAAPLLVRELARLSLGPELRKVHQALILVLGTDPDGSVPQWSAMAEIVETQLGYGLTAKEYASNLDLLGGQLVALKALGLVMPALGILEALCDAECPASESRLNFVVQIQGLFAQLHAKVTRSNQLIFAGLATFAGLPVSPPQPDGDPTSAENSMSWFAGKTVALYSLNNAALARAKSALEAEVPQIVVRCSSDEKGGGPALRELARNADLFIICTSAATHSATTYIEQERGTKPRRRVHRKGAAALVDEARGYALEVAG